MRRSFLAITALFALILCADLASAAEKSKFKGSLGVRGGYRSFMGESEFWDSMRNTFDGDASEFNSFSYGLELTVPLIPALDLHFGVDYFKKTMEFDSEVAYTIRTVVVNDSGSSATVVREVKDFQNEFTFELMPIHLLGLRFHPLKKKSWYSPFFGAEATLLLWRYEETGTFVIFDPESLDAEGNPIPNRSTSIEFKNTKMQFYDSELAFNLQAGIEFYPHKNLTLALWGRYTFCTDQVARKFRRLELNPRPGGQDQGIQDVFVRKFQTYEFLDLSSWESNISIMYRF